MDMGKSSSCLMQNQFDNIINNINDRIDILEQRSPMRKQGPMGERGSVGKQGPMGERGSVGKQGPNGEQGHMRKRDYSGKQGPNGEKGYMGERGCYSIAKKWGRVY
jgi:hypothetical protein